MTATAEEPVEEKGRWDGSKAKHIRDALDVLGDVKPVEVIEWLRRERDIDVTPVYVSVIKSQYRGKTKQQYSAAAYVAAKQLVRIVGGINQAKALLDNLDAEQEFVGDMQQRYQQLLAEAEQKLSEPESSLTKGEKRELLSEVRRLRKLLGSITELGTLAST